VLGLADRVLVMREGRVVHEAPADELTEADVLDLVMAGRFDLTDVVAEEETA
jgi:ribose transport system ATP-binding protein